MAYLYISQDSLDEWSSKDQIKLDGNRVVFAGHKAKFVLYPAVRFLKVSGAENDPHGFLGKVKTQIDITQSGGELYMDSVLYGDTAYDVETGFLAEEMAP